MFTCRQFPESLRKVAADNLGPKKNFKARSKNKSGIPALEIDDCFLCTVNRVGCTLEGMGNTVTSRFSVPKIVPLVEDNKLRVRSGKAHARRVRLRDERLKDERAGSLQRSNASSVTLF